MEGGVPLDAQIGQLREFLKTYQRVTQVCFLDCVQDFGTRDLTAVENKCQENCLKKYMAI